MCTLVFLLSIKAISKIFANRNMSLIHFSTSLGAKCPSSLPNL